MLPSAHGAVPMISGEISSTFAKTGLTSTKLSLDKIIDPTTDNAEVRRKIDDLTAKARAMLGPNPTDIDKIGAVRQVLYKAGPWNDYHPFTYNHADPYGKDIKTKLLANYLHTRLGNCVSMPTLFLIIADRLGGGFPRLTAQKAALGPSGAPWANCPAQRGSGPMKAAWGWGLPITRMTTPLMIWKTTRRMLRI